MNPESAKRIMDAYLDVFEDLSLRTFKQGLDFVVGSFEEKLKVLRQIRSQEGLLATLLKEPEPEPDVLDAQIQTIRLLPYTLRKVMPDAMRDFAKVMPHDPGGRPNKLDHEDSRYVCAEIGNLIGQGVRVLPAQQRLALRMSKKKGKDVSLRTIQRAWENRAKWCNGNTVESDDCEESSFPKR